MRDLMKIPVVRLRGELLNLCVPRTDDEALSKYVSWMNDEDILMWLSRNDRVTHWKDEKEWTEKDHGNMFNIVAKDGVLIGNCEVNPINNTRNYVIGICIGDKNYRGQGYGTEVVKLLIKYAFEECNAHRVCISLNADNARAKRCYEKAGFKEWGREHEAIWYGGHWADYLHMDILESDYFKK